MSLESPLNIPVKLVTLYRKFYRANSKYNPSTNSVLKPLLTAKEVIKYSTFTETEDLVAAVAGTIEKDMRAIKANTSKGYWVLADDSEQRASIFNFARFVVEELYIKTFKKDKSKFSSKGIGIIENTVECLYRIEQDKENKLGKFTRESTEEYFGDYEWELSYPDEGELLISGPGKLEILIDLDFTLANKTTPNYGSELSQLSVEYPVELKDNYSEDSYTLQVITTGDGITNTARLYIGTKVSWAIPFNFARELQSALMGKSVV
jgi:hypothetical protein